MEKSDQSKPPSSGPDETENDDCFNSANDNNTNDSTSVDLDHQDNSRSSGSTTATTTKHQRHSDEPEQLRKLFIGGLDYKTSESELKQHFEKFGDVLDCVVMRDSQSKKSRGFGFVIYANSQMVDRAQEARPHEVDGREVQSKRAISREDSGKPEAQATVKKAYLGGLSDDTEESELRDYFKQFGNIVNVQIVAHKDTGKRRGFGFVEYDDYDPVDKIVLKKFHTIKDKRIEAKKAIPKNEMDARNRVDPRSPLVGPMCGMAAPQHEGLGPRQRSGRNGWDSGPYSPYASGYSGQPNYGYPPTHFHSPQGHYGPSDWPMHGGGGGSRGGMYYFRGNSNGAGGGGYGRISHQGGGWNNNAEYAGGYPAPHAGSNVGPMRINYQNRAWAPYGPGHGPHRGRGYNH